MPVPILTSGAPRGLATFRPHHPRPNAHIDNHRNGACTHSHVRRTQGTGNISNPSPQTKRPHRQPPKWCLYPSSRGFQRRPGDWQHFGPITPDQTPTSTTTEMVPVPVFTRFPTPPRGLATFRTHHPRPNAHIDNHRNGACTRLHEVSNAAQGTGNISDPSPQTKRPHRQPPKWCLYPSSRGFQRRPGDWQHFGPITPDQTPTSTTTEMVPVPVPPSPRPKPPLSPKVHRPGGRQTSSPGRQPRENASPLSKSPPKAGDRKPEHAPRSTPPGTGARHPGDWLGLLRPTTKNYAIVLQPRNNPCLYPS